MKKMTEQDGRSRNIVNENLSALKSIFPEAFTEDSVEFEVLRQLLGDAVDEGEEKYGLNWHGKKKARQIALTPSLGTLRPCSEESVDWNTTQNLFIEGDNLEVLKLLQKSYANKVKMIYIDPPYNTGKEFIYPDKFQDNLETYLRYTGLKDDEGNKTSSMANNKNTVDSARYHTNWLNMMYPRLKLAKNLLKDDGVIFISIDDNEVANLRKLCDEIFGEENFVSELIWKSGRTAASHFTNEHEYMICYAKNKDNLPLFKFDGDEKISDRAIKRPTEKNPTSQIRFPAGLDFECEDKIFPLKFGESEPITIMNGIFEAKDGKLLNEVVIEAAWTMKDMIEKWLKGEDVLDQKGQKVTRFFFKSNGVLQYEKEKGTIHPKSIIEGITTKSGSNEIKSVLGDSYFDFPKPSKLISQIAKVVANGKNSEIILDFFAGSCTTANSVLDLNAEDGGNRKFVMVQLPEPCDEKAKAFKAGYKTIAEIGKDRIRRAAAKIKEENPNYEGDFGLKVFKLDSSNIRAWNPDRNDLEQTLIDHMEHLVEGRSEEDVLYELLLKRGVDLTVPIEKKTITGKTVYSIGYGVLFACLDSAISRKEIEDLAMGIIDWHKELEPAGDTQVVFRDSAFANDITKTNMTAILEQHGITHVRSL